MFNQFNLYQFDNNLIYTFQSLFRASFSTQTVLTYLYDNIKFNNDDGLYTELALFDLQKAFDNVDHSIRLKKIEAIRAKNVTVDWFKSCYTQKNPQGTHVNGCRSRLMNITWGHQP